MPSPPYSQTIPRTEWRSAVAHHREVLESIIEPYLEQRSRGGKDPVLDFLFEYYAFRPSHLLRWSPGIGVRLLGNTEDLDLDKRYVHQESGGFSISTDSFLPGRMDGLQWTIDLLGKTASREPAYGCHGLHEWAMVYESTDLRHNQFPLRLGSARTNEVVKASKIHCTHFDAYRFFTHSATRLNRQDLTRQGMLLNEQPGCLHTNMDLYKWATKHFPWISSAIIRKAFLLALDIRKVDMRASPYDLSELGLEPLRIEEDSGRLEYRRYQSQFYGRAATLRRELIDGLKLLQNQITSGDAVSI